MAYVPASHAEAGAQVSLAQRGKIFSARVVSMPFVAHRYHRKGVPK
jgi:aminomethyltransferase